MADANTRYDDKQVGLILKRATELATDSSPDSSPGDGLSLAELEQIAVEAGIDPALIRRAAQEVDGGEDSGEYGWVMGAPMTIRVHRVVDEEVPDDFFDDVLAEIHVAGIGHGTASLVGRTLSWKGMGGGQTPDSLQITVSSRDGRTELHAEQKRTQAVGGLLGGMVGGGGVGLGVGLGVPLGINLLGSVAAAVAFPAVVVGGAYVLARRIFQSGHRKRQRDLEQLLDRLVEQIRQASAKRLEESADASSLPPGNG